ncbi:MAG TPA: hypothetical protein VHD56_05535 [Tepidisphaeraceae bacterium]|nr:hypothetical protein [Tepidisphaeraceae bacterium]
MSTAAQQVPGKPATGYDVARPMGKCHVSGQPIEQGTRFMTALRETLTGLERLDISMEAWQTFDRKDVLAFWMGIMPAPQEAKKKVFVDDQVLCELFERLGTTEESAKLNFRFVLGLILMRKRMIQYESTRQEQDREIWKVRFKGGEDLLDLLNPRLDEQQVAAVSQQLGEILNQEL